MKYLVAYDISDNRRRSRLAHHLERNGLRIQRSVFLLDVRHHGIAKLKREIRDITVETDELLLVPLQGGSEKKMLILGDPPDPFVVI